MGSDVMNFLRESNGIEGIFRDPTATEVAASHCFMSLRVVALHDLNDVQQAYAPGHVLRDRAGLNVRVGRYVAPVGGLAIRTQLENVIAQARTSPDPWRVHVAFEMLHPYTDGNGRTGRILWAWHMQRLGRDPFALPFLHRFYYQTLEAQQS